MKSRNKKYIIILSILLFLGLIAFGIQQSVFNVNYEKISPPTCDNNFICYGSHPEDSNPRFSQYWAITDLGANEWNAYELRNPIMQQFFFVDFDLSILKSHAIIDDKGRIEYFKDMNPVHCFNSSNVNENLVVHSILSDNGYPRAYYLWDVFLACGKYDKAAVSGFRDLKFARQESGSSCPTLIYSYQKMNGLSRCIANEYGEYVCTYASGLYQGACEESGEANKVSFSTYEYKYSPQRYDFAVIDILNSQRTTEMLNKYTDVKTNLLNPEYSVDKNGYYVRNTHSTLNQWLIDRFMNKTCWVEMNTNALNENNISTSYNLKVYGRTENFDNKMTCRLDDSNYGSINNLKADEASLSKLTLYGEKDLVGSEIEVKFDFSTSEFPKLASCNNGDNKCVDKNSWLCENSEYVDKGQIVGKCGVTKPIEPPQLTIFQRIINFFKNLFKF